MLIQIGIEQLQCLISKQLDSLLIYDAASDGSCLAWGIERSLERTEGCFRHVANKYYRKDGKVCFNPFHSSQNTIFLYYLANTVGKAGGRPDLAERIYYLNKILNSVDLYYEIDLPAVFGLDHPVGSVMGHATYGDYFFFAQNCTVGNNKGIYPVIGEHVTLCAGATLLGNSKVGRHCILSAGCTVVDQDIPENSVVFGRSPDLVMKRKDDAYFESKAGFWLKVHQGKDDNDYETGRSQIP